MDDLRMQLELNDDKEVVFIARSGTEENLQKARELLEDNGYTVFLITAETFFVEVDGMSPQRIFSMNQSYGAHYVVPEGYPKPPIAFVVMEAELEKMKRDFPGFLEAWRSEAAYTIQVQV